MDHFEYRDGVLYAEDVNLADLAQTVGTPFYCYSTATLRHHYGVLHNACAKAGLNDTLICYSVKANSNIGVIATLARLGAGADIVSLGELQRAMAAGIMPEKIVFSGVGKTDDEMAAGLEAGIRQFNVESLAELDQLAAVADRLGKTAQVALRVNPDVDAGTHPYISTGLKENKFGIAAESALRVYLNASQMPGILVTGIDCHIGSQLTTVEPFLDAIDRLLLMTDLLAAEGITISHFDMGGGLGVTYGDENPPLPAELMASVRSRFEGKQMMLIVEPGRSIAANAGLFVTSVEYLKHTEHKNFAIVDGAMNDLLRPALYGAWQEIIPVSRRRAPVAVYDVVGPVCESADFLGKDRSLSMEAGDLLAVRSAGAYGFVMGSNYNTRPRAAEVMVDGSAHHLVRKRESLEELLHLESCLPE